jgi:signal transduction histidine kinase
VRNRIRFPLAAGLLVLILLLAGLAAEAKAGHKPERPSEDLACAAQVARAAVHTAAAGLSGLLKTLPDEAARLSALRAFVDAVRFYSDKTGYFYAYDSRCVNVAHATQKDLVGKNLYDHRDRAGKYVIRELLAAAKQGGGFVEFFWEKPGATGTHKKLGYVEPIPGTDWFIGAGVYME